MSNNTENNDTFFYTEENSNFSTLKGLKSFTFFIRVPAKSPNAADLLRQDIIKMLGKEGKVVQKSLLIKTPVGEALDYSKLPHTEASIIYQISPVIDLQGKELSVIKASVKVVSGTTIDKTGEKTSSIIWEESCYFPEKLNSNSQSLIIQGFQLLFESFSSSYKKANPKIKENPSFYVLF